ncbi:MAG: D-aminoacyl-tRNA deacylase, partial [Bacteroidales bacterium]|nr:D-aminoacyl-tRNA deacylase [Bacteroidales bacterium]
MRVVIQRVIESSVTIDGNVKGKIGKGLMILVGFLKKKLIIHTGVSIQYLVKHTLLEKKMIYI